MTIALKSCFRDYLYAVALRLELALHLFSERQYILTAPLVAVDVSLWVVDGLVEIDQLVQQFTSIVVFLSPHLGI